MLDATQHALQHDAKPLSDEPRLTQFSICYTPRPGSALASFGRSWFGRANDGTTLQAFSLSGLGSGAPDGITTTPDRYLGLHAPFFSPLTLREHARLEDIKTRLAHFAAHRKAIETGPLKLMRARRALVLRPANPRPELDWLALQCFNAFDSFAAMSETAEDGHPHLSPYQRLLLKSFGQPNVMSEYRFSMRLAGPLDPQQLDRLSEALAPLIAGLCAEGVCVDGLSLIGTRSAAGSGQNPGPSARLLGRYPLAG
ncbi:hypothetical protein AUC68_08520 [Methyloceanibacter methanicus]|uniref:Uncharacterized protein n=1 Tax=Methyloceanibacter methanicus TaxID=1774968 RepID=A0A1E3VY45_9HYPH|nr:DUF1045 domain-containing protein [Methyloceanibacter methanicus]ODR98464.1 hypothetical protein AUC68_08520 [Methyloceanibacter methanicus]